MNHEVEQKFRIADPAAVRKRLEALGAKFADPVEQVDAYFNHPSRDFAMTDEALRIRSVGERNFVTYKGPKLDRDVKMRRELEQPLADGPEAAKHFAELLVALGFRPTARVVKHRIAGTLDWQGTHYEIAADVVQHLGPFLELELVVDESHTDAAKKQILTLQNELGLTEVERRSYLEMVLEAGR